MHFLSSSGRLAPLVLLISFFQIAVFASQETTDAEASQLAARQAARTTCAEYSMVANYSTISDNSTYRSAYLQASPLGTDPTTVALDQATLKMPPLKINRELNDRCGNLSTLAAEAAATNFTNGIVGPFRILAAANAALAIGGGAGVGTTALVAMMVFAGLWL